MGPLAREKPARLQRLRCGRPIPKRTGVAGCNAICADGVNSVMVETAYLQCKKCGTRIPVDNISVNYREGEGVLFVRYDPAYTKIVLINTESGLKHTVDLSSEKQIPKPASRQIAGIIGPY